MWPSGASRLWRAAYRRVVRSSFDTVPLYRERWALDGRSDPVLVPGRTGEADGAITAADALRHLADLVPLAGGSDTLDPARGLGPVLRQAVELRPDALVALVDPDIPHPPADLRRGQRGCVADPDAPPPELLGALRRGRQVIAVGRDKDIARIAAVLPADAEPLLDRLPQRALDHIDSGPYGVLHDHVLGFFGVLRDCGRWHLDWPRVYARRTRRGLAFTLLAQRSPRLVDVLVAGGVRGEIVACPRHGTPVVRT